MSNIANLKSYLIQDDGYLFNDTNNGSVVMLSGVWGSGKTHFWKNTIEPELSELKNKEKAYVYVSLYGKESLESIKNEILLKAYESVKEENPNLKKTIAAFDYFNNKVSFSLFGAKIDSKSIGSDLKKLLYENKKFDEAKEFLLNGGVICFDDFERKSEKISLNDLFGFISQLSEEMKCKIIIILNSDVFEGKEAVTFRSVKEKTVNKFLYFSPLITELLDVIFSNQKYESLIPYKDEIFSQIELTKELNARIYIQVLDNCLEWITKGYQKDALKALIIVSTFFSKYHVDLNCKIINDDIKIYSVSDYFWKQGYYDIANFLTRQAPQIFSDKKTPVDEAIQMLMTSINKEKTDAKDKTSDDYKKRQNEEIEIHRDMIRDFIRYIVIDEVDSNLDKEIYIEVNNFVKTGILLRSE